MTSWRDGHNSHLATLDELREAIGEALAAGEPLELVAAARSAGSAGPCRCRARSICPNSPGSADYQPDELVLTARAATPLDEIEAALAPSAQMLAFEPPDWRALLGVPAGDAGGAPSAARSPATCRGPRRIKAGAARDHFLGFRGVSGRGEIFKSGGKVVKNVTGYDLSKLMAGSYGTLAALEEVTVKVLPRPEHTATVVLCGLDPAAAVRGDEPRACLAARGFRAPPICRLARPRR